MESYWIAAVRCEPGEAYNIGGDTTISVGEFLELLEKHSRVRVSSRQDPSLLRPADVTLRIPDVSKFTRATGRRPRRDFDESVRNLLDYWRVRVGRRG